MVVRMRRSGMTYAAIADELGVSETTVMDDFKTTLKQIPATDVDEYRKVELLRLEWALHAAEMLVAEAKTHSQALNALRVYLDAERAIRQLVGADAPLRQEVMVLTDELLAQKLAEVREERDRRLALVAG